MVLNRDNVVRPHVLLRTSSRPLIPCPDLRQLYDRTMLRQNDFGLLFIGLPMIALMSRFLTRHSAFGRASGIQTVRLHSENHQRATSNSRRSRQRFVWRREAVLCVTPGNKIALRYHTQSRHTAQSAV